MRRSLLSLVILVAGLGAPGCLVVSLNPAYDDESIGFDPGLVGSWHDAEDNCSLQIERGEWKSYRIHYVHPVENGEVTAYMTAVGDARYLDVMPVSGVDRGSFVVPVHVLLRVRLDGQGERLEVTPLSYDWFAERLRARDTAVSGLIVAFDQKENAFVASPSMKLREWLRRQPESGAVFGASALFQRR